MKRRKTRLSKAEGERLERHEFLLSPQARLGGRRPVELADTDLGTRQVEEVLFQLEYSLPA